MKSTVNVAQGSALVSATNPLHVLSVSPSTTATAGYTSSQSKTRPADTPTYTALDVISESASAGTDLDFDSIGPSGGGKIIITRAELRVDLAAVPSGMTTFKIHLYSSAPTAINDDAAFNLPSGDRAKYLGSITLPTPTDIGDTLYSDTEDSLPIRKELTLASSSVYGILQTTGGYTAAASTVYTVKLHAIAV